MIRLKDSFKLIGISVISCCAVFVCTLFLNKNIDLSRIESLINTAELKVVYDVTVLIGDIVVYLSGGCLLGASVVMLFFYIKNYIDVHKKDLGILKALGYSNLKLALNFWIFGFSVFVGAFVGFCSAFVYMPSFYESQNAGHILPDITLHFNFSLLVYLVILPTILFGIISVLYSYYKLKCPVMELLRDKNPIKIRKIKKLATKEVTFLQELKKNTIRTRPSLIFFIGFASFCYSTLTQMFLNMNDLAGDLAFIIILIGLVLAFTILFISITTVVNANKKYICIMKVFGYSFAECCNAILNGYRPIAFIGFVIGTIYQYVIFVVVVKIASDTLGFTPNTAFNFSVFVIVLVSFAIVYELIIKCYSVRIKNISIKEIMLD